MIVIAPLSDNPSFFFSPIGLNSVFLFQLSILTCIVFVFLQMPVSVVNQKTNKKTVLVRKIMLTTF